MQFRFVGKVLFLLMGLYSLLRLVFLAFNFRLFSQHELGSLVQSFVHGMRFDFSSVLILNGVLILSILLTPQRVFANRYFQKVLRGLFVLFNYPFVVANLIDAEYYKFSGHRMNFDIFIFRNEAVRQMDQFFINFWHVAFLAVAGFFYLFYFFPKAQTPNTPAKKNLIQQTLKTSAVLLLSAFVLVFGIRGGFQLKPIQPVHAYASGATSELGVLTLNSSFTLLKTRQGVNLEPVSFFASAEDVFLQLKQPTLAQRDIASSNHRPKPQNVVIIMLESFGAEFWGSANDGKGFTPFLDELAKNGALFKHSYANGLRSIDALPAVFFGVPALVHTPLVKTNYYGNRWNGIGHIAKRAGIYTSFFHGAPKGTMYFDAITAMAGIENFYSLENYPNMSDFDGHWGIFDEPFLQFALSKINLQPQPFFTTAFTISSHQPYPVPEHYKGVFPAGRMQIHECIGYVDHAVKRFFEEAKKQPWYKNTLFIITGDHSQMSQSETINSSIGRHLVPLLFFHPTQNLSKLNTDRVTQHVDILPSILDFWKIHNEPHLLFGRSVFDNSQVGEAIFYTYGGHWLMHKNHFLQFSDKDLRGTLFAITDTTQQHPITDQEDLRMSMELRIKSYIQYYHNSLIENNLYSWFDL